MKIAKLLGIALAIAVALAVGMHKDELLGGVSKLFHASSPSGSAHRIVTVDVAQLLNAQRKLASTIIEGNTSAAPEVVTTIQSVGARMYETIQEVAGPNTLVLVKQTVVVPAGVEDITQEVLKRLNLPLDAPTIDPSVVFRDGAQTNLSLSGARQEYEKNASEEMRQFRLHSRKDDGATKDVIP